MIVCFRCSPRTKETLDLLLESGQYRDYSEVISLAIANLAVLQEEVLEGESAAIGADAGAHVCAFEGEVSGDAQDTQEPSQESSLITKPFLVPAIFKLDGLPGSPPPLAALPDDIWAPGREIPLDRWVFGQYNRLLPAKVSCRALAHLLLSQPKGILLEDAARQIADKAAVLGDFLAHHDRQNGIARDDALATAFPSSGGNPDKSRLRYANQFVASVNRQGQVSGLLIDLKLINGRGGRKATRLMLTKIGWQFATLPNPILDGLQETPTQKFSEAERDFLLAHIAESVPVEDFAYRTILAAIIEGKNTPDTIDAALLRHMPQDADRKPSASFLSSQRSGAISRMTDLELVKRIRDGVRVLYVATAIGERYLRDAHQLTQGAD